MKFIKKLKKFLNKDMFESDKVTKVESDGEMSQSKIINEKEVDYSHLPMCDWCKNRIHQHEPRQSYPKGKNSKKYHTACCRKLRKEAKKLIMRGDPMALRYA